MPLHYEVTEPLTIPAAEFNENHIAVLLVVGADSRESGQAVRVKVSRPPVVSTVALP